MGKRHQKGDIAEAYIEARLLDAGFSVLQPVSNHSRYDLAVDAGGELIRIQCKFARCKEDERGEVIRFNTESHNNSYDGDADYIIGYCADRDEAYVVAVEDAPKGQMTLRPPEADLKRTNYTDDYALLESPMARDATLSP